MKVIDDILNKLFCMHDWQHLNTYEWQNGITRTRWEETYVCKKCGKFRKIKI